MNWVQVNWQSAAPASQRSWVQIPYGPETNKLLLQLAYVFQNNKNFTGNSYFNSTLFTIALQKSLSLLFVCLKIYTCSIRGFRCSLAVSKSSLFGLHLDREIFQKPFYTSVTFSQISSQNIKPHNQCIKQSKARNEKVKTCECSVEKKKKHRADSDQGSWFSHRSEKCAKKKCFFVAVVF